jgi:Leucine-rich repeat (LRR) protein
MRNNIIIQICFLSVCFGDNYGKIIEDKNNLNLNRFPTSFINRAQDIEELFLKWNTISEVNTSVLATLTSLSHLDMTYNLLQEFPDLRSVCNTLKIARVQGNA